MGNRKLHTFRITLYTKYGTGICERKAKDFEDLILNRMNKTEKANWFELEDMETSEAFTHFEWLDRLGVTAEEHEALSR